MSLRLGNTLIPTVNIRLSSSGVTNYQTKTVTPGTNTITVTADSSYDALSSVTVNAIPSQYLIPSGNKSITSNGSNIDVAAYATVSVNVPVGSTINNTTLTVTPSTTQQVFNVASPYTGYETVTVNAISTMTLPTTLATSSSGTSRATFTLTAGTKYLNIPTGYNSANAYYSFSVASGSVSNPTATKSTVSNYTITITPKVTSTTGYITGTTNQTGTAVTVSASELVSGTKSITANGSNIDVTNYKYVTVNVPTGGGGITPSGTLSITENGTYDVTNYASAEVILPSMTLPTAAAASATSGYTSKATIGRSTSAQYINIPPGYLSSGAYYTISAVANGSVSNPTIIQGTVTNNSITLTPKVVSSAGFINGNDNQRGTAVTISASQLVSGNKAITANGTNIDVTNYATVSVSVSSTINNQDKTVTPSTSQQTINADSGYSGLGTVTVNAIQTETKSATPSTTAQTITPSSGKYLTSVSISAIQTETKSATPSGSSQTITPSSGKYLTSVTVAAVPTETKSITANGTYTPTSGKWFSSVTVNVPVGSTINNRPSVSVTPIESEQTIGFDSSTYTGLSEVIVGAISSTYVGSGITSRSSSDLTVSGATVTAPAGYYSAAASKSVASMTLPTTLSTTSSGTRVITIDRSTSTRYLNIPTGYNATASYYQISAVANGVVTNSGSTSGSSATVSTGTNTITLTKSVSITPSVTTAGYISSGTAGNVSVALTASVTTKGATTYRATTSQQTIISSGTYITGNQTLAAITQTNLSAANIKAGTTVTISNGSANLWLIAGTFTSDATAAAGDIVSGETAYVNGSKITGELVVVTYYTGSTAPSSSLGSNGDIYLQS